MNQHIDSYAKLAKSVVLGTIAGIFSTVILMIVFALVINAVFGDPDGVVNAFTCVAASAGALTGGFFASRINGSKGFISGITTGFIISLVLLTIMIFTGKSPADAAAGENASVALKLVIILCQIVFACAGGVFSANSNKGRKPPRPYSITPPGKKK